MALNADHGNLSAAVAPIVAELDGQDMLTGVVIGRLALYCAGTVCALADVAHVDPADFWSGLATKLAAVEG